MSTRFIRMFAPCSVSPHSTATDNSDTFTTHMHIGSAFYTYVVCCTRDSDRVANSSSLCRVKLMHTCTLRVKAMQSHTHMHDTGSYLWMYGKMQFSSPFRASYKSMQIEWNTHNRTSTSKQQQRLYYAWGRVVRVCVWVRFPLAGEWMWVWVCCEGILVYIHANLCYIVNVWICYICIHKNTQELDEESTLQSALSNAKWIADVRVECSH